MLNIDKSTKAFWHGVLMLSNQDWYLNRMYAELKRLRESDIPLPAELGETLDGLDDSLAQLHSINEELNQKNLELAVQHQKFRELFDLAPDAFLVTNAQGTILDANTSAAELIKKDLSYLAGKPLSIFVSESDHRNFLERLRQLGGPPQTRQWEMQIASRDDTFRSVTCRVVASPPRGEQPMLLYWLIHDITERVQMERKLAEVNAELEKRVEERIAQLAGAHADLRHLTGRLVSLQEEERRQISRELHDEAGQGLIALRMNLEALRDELPPEMDQVRARLIEAGELAYRTMESLRVLSQDLRPPAIDIVELDAVLIQLCHEITRRTQLPISYSGTTLPPLDVALKMSLYRFLQEALNNVIRHSRATHAEVCLQHDDHEITLSVVDNGIGFDTASMFANRQLSGIGLLGMRERIELLGGRLIIESNRDRGTQVAATVPIA